jgi:hypothetical protein
MKIFLSHKTADKSLVRDFAATLRQLGFDPWLDEEEIVASKNLHRSIMDGMRSSCAAIFFVTPNFVDEKYIGNEINYAVAEKTARGDDFSIITILLEIDGVRGTVPPVLQEYVWKEPKSQLECLRDIIRALPVCVGSVYWRRLRAIEASIERPRITLRDEIAGVTELWCAWHSGTITLFTQELIGGPKKVRVILTRPDSAAIHEVAKATDTTAVSSTQLSSQIRELTQMLIANGMEVAWLDGLIGSSTIIADPNNDDRSWARIENFLPIISPRHRMSIRFGMHNNPEAFQRLKSLYERLWEKSEKISPK